MMDVKLSKNRRVFEIMLIVVVLGMAGLYTQMGPHRSTVLHLFFLPVVLSGYFLGRTSAGVLALLCALCVTIASSVLPTGFAAMQTPLMMGLALTVWGGVLGLTAILAGTLCDERATTVDELHKAYVGVVEVLAKYLQGGNPRVKARSVRLGELSQLVAERLGLPQKQTDDIRVAAMLYQLGNVEITTQVISKAFDALDPADSRHTFLGTELVHSLGSVLEGALPLLANQDDDVRDYLRADDNSQSRDMPLGARVIRAVRAYDKATGIGGDPDQVHAHAIRHLQVQFPADHTIIDAIDAVARRCPMSFVAEAELLSAVGTA